MKYIGIKKRLENRFKLIYVRCGTLHTDELRLRETCRLSETPQAIDGHHSGSGALQRRRVSVSTC